VQKQPIGSQEIPDRKPTRGREGKKKKFPYSPSILAFQSIGKKRLKTQTEYENKDTKIGKKRPKIEAYEGHCHRRNGKRTARILLSQAVSAKEIKNARKKEKKETTQVPAKLGGGDVVVREITRNKNEGVSSITFQRKKKGKEKRGTGV